MNTYWLTQEEYRKVVALEAQGLREHEALIAVVPYCKDNDNFVSVACGSSSAPVDGLKIIWLEDTQP